MSRRSSSRDTPTKQENSFRLLVKDGKTVRTTCGIAMQNVLFNFGRAVGGLGPFVVGAVAAQYSFHTAIALLASIYVLDILATVFLIPELKGKELE
jgi:hypothetical protein